MIVRTGALWTVLGYELQGFKILAEEPFSYFIVVFKWLLIKHSPV